jgi:hypothetical protein
MSLIGTQAAVMRKKGLNKGTWHATDLVVIDHETPTNVRAAVALYAKPGFERRESSAPTSGLSRIVRLSFEPGDIKAARAASEQRKQEIAARDAERIRREDWLKQIKPALASQFVNYIHAHDSDEIIKALADNLSEAELAKICTALNLET